MSAVELTRDFRRGQGLAAVSTVAQNMIKYPAGGQSSSFGKAVQGAHASYVI